MAGKLREARKQGAYALPASLVREVKIEAANQSVYPNEVVETALREYLARRKSRARETVSA